MLQNQPQHTCSSFRVVISNLKTYYENKKQLLPHGGKITQSLLIYPRACQASY